MGVFSGLLSGLLGGSGLGDIASKAMDIGGKLFNRKPGESFGDALIGQLPAIAGGLGGVAKNFGNFIPGIGGIVSKIGGMVESGAKEFEQPDTEHKKLELENIPKGLFSELLNWYDKKLKEEDSTINSDLNALVPDIGDGYPLGDMMYKAWEGNQNPDYNNRSHYEDAESYDFEHYFEDEIKKWLNKPSMNDINSPIEMLKHASNNLPIMLGGNAHMPVEPAMASPMDRHFPANSSGSSSSNWRQFKPPTTVRIDPMHGDLHDINMNNMYASNLPSVMHKTTGEGQTLADLKPVSFLKSFLR